MSGGLDSTSIAAIGARQLAAASGNHRMRAVSWVFDELRECDERVFIDAVTAECGLDALQVVGDNDWPLRHPEMMGCNPSTPEQNPYRELKQRAYREAVAKGSRAVFSGATADAFSAGCEPMSPRP